MKKIIYITIAWAFDVVAMNSASVPMEQRQQRKEHFYPVKQLSDESDKSQRKVRTKKLEKEKSKLKEQSRTISGLTKQIQNLEEQLIEAQRKAEECRQVVSEHLRIQEQWTAAQNEQVSESSVERLETLIKDAKRFYDNAGARISEERTISPSQNAVVSENPVEQVVTKARKKSRRNVSESRLQGKLEKVKSKIKEQMIIIPALKEKIDRLNSELHAVQQKANEDQAEIQLFLRDYSVKDMNFVLRSKRTQLQLRKAEESLDQARELLDKMPDPQRFKQPAMPLQTEEAKKPEEAKPTVSWFWRLFGYR